MIQIHSIQDFPIIETENQFWTEMKEKLGPVIQDGDVLVCAHTPWSRVRNHIHKLDEIVPTDPAIELANELGKNPRKIELILQSSRKIVKTGRGVIISENHAGVVCANAGVDESNAGLGYAITIPDDPDTLADEIRQFIKSHLHKNVAVIISDTVGRALRQGAVNIAIGVSGLNPIKSYIGQKDLFDREMNVTEIAIADELASAAELLQGQSDEGIPIVIIRGFLYEKGTYSARVLNRPERERLFK